MPRLFFVALLTFVIASPAPVGASPWRATISLPDDAWRIGAPDAFAIADHLGERERADEALGRSGWREHLRMWARGRIAWQQRDYASALQDFEESARVWPDDEPELVSRIFDEQWLELALDAADGRVVKHVIRHPVREHDDAIWLALRARAELQEGDAEDAAVRFEDAWEQADGLERRHPAFLHATTAWLQEGDATRAVDAWQRSISQLRRPERMRLALALWDAHPELAEAVARHADPGPTMGFLTRTLRRAEALEIARSRIDAGLGDRTGLELFVAEQLYRLRRHDELLAWLDQIALPASDHEALASVEGYRWGVARREGSTLEVARGFDGVAETWPETARAAEAWWESAWMYELNDEFDEAVRRYARHVRATGDGQFRSSAAVRTGLLPWREGDRTRALANFRHFADALGTGMDQAAAWWLSELAGAGTTALRTEHPASPFWRGTTPTLSAAEVPDEVALYRQQKAAFAVIADYLGAPRSLQEFPEDLAAIARLAELGLRAEATIRLEDWARSRSGDDVARLRAAWVAFQWGLPETQARQGWFLENRLGGRDAGLDVALRTAGLPTPFARPILRIAESLELPPAILWSLMRRESFFDAEVVSLAGAHGLMQLMPATASSVASRLEMGDPSPSSLFIPALNVRLGATYLAGLRDEAAGNWIRALAAYNAGEQNGRRWEARLREGEPPELGILLISFSETRSYVYNVLRVAHLYEDLWRAANQP